MVEELDREYGDRFERAEIETLIEDSIERLCGAAVGSAPVSEFLPILAYRFTRERLEARRRTEGCAEGVPHVDWRVGDPSGADVDEVRRVRDDIERCVRALLESLGVAATEASTLQPA